MNFFEQVLREGGITSEEWDVELKEKDGLKKKIDGILYVGRIEKWKMGWIEK